jgi:hypothetical protein
MARLKGNGLQGGFTGRLGDVVGCRWKDTYYIRSRPKKVNHPNTEAQLKQRMRFIKTQNFLSPLKEFLRVGYGAFTADKSAYNAAMSYNIKNALNGNYPNIEIDPSKVLISRGSLPKPSETAVKASSKDTVNFFWNSVEKAPFPAMPNDKALLVVRSLTSKEADYKMDAARRSDGEATIKLPADFQGAEIACYLIFVRQEVLLGNYAEESISDSIFCGKLHL